MLSQELLDVADGIEEGEARFDDENFSGYKPKTIKIFNLELLVQYVSVHYHFSSFQMSVLCRSWSLFMAEVFLFFFGESYVLIHIALIPLN